MIQESFQTFIKHGNLLIKEKVLKQRVGRSSPAGGMMCAALSYRHVETSGLQARRQKVERRVRIVDIDAKNQI